MWEAAPDVGEAVQRKPLNLKGISNPVENFSIAVGDILHVNTAERDAAEARQP